jgi:peptide chain release factor 3
MLARDRDTVEYAYPGDIIGVINPGVFAIGDTVSFGPQPFDFTPMPQFPPEVLAQVRPVDVMKRKSFDKGIRQLSDEGAVQLLRSFENPDSPPLVAAVGKLQFDVLEYRLKDEYHVDSVIEYLPYRYSSYLIGDPRTLRRTQGSYLAIDGRGNPVLLYTSEWEKRFILEQNKDHGLKEFVA